MSSRVVTILRYIGNAQVIIGYFVLLYVHEFTGLALCFCANALLFPWALKEKAWDVVVIAAFFAALNGGKMLLLMETT